MKTYYVGSIPVSDELYHHGIKGQKWGIRRYQNEDGTLTAAGQQRYYGSNSGRKMQKDLNRYDKEAAYAIGDYNKHNKAEERLRNKAKRMIERNTKDGVASLNKRQTAKLIKMSQKAIGHIKQAEIAEQNLKQIEQQQWKIMAEAHNQGYKVLSTPKYRSTVRKGEQNVNLLLFGGIGAGIKQVRDYGAQGTVTQGQKFKVRRNVGG